MVYATTAHTRIYRRWGRRVLGRFTAAANPFLYKQLKSPPKYCTDRVTSPEFYNSREKLQATAADPRSVAEQNAAAEENAAGAAQIDAATHTAAVESANRKGFYEM